MNLINHKANNTFFQSNCVEIFEYTPKHSKIESYYKKVVEKSGFFNENATVKGLQNDYEKVKSEYEISNVNSSKFSSLKKYFENNYHSTLNLASKLEVELSIYNKKKSFYNLYNFFILRPITKTLFWKTTKELNKQKTKVFHLKRLINAQRIELKFSKNCSEIIEIYSKLFDSLMNLSRFEVIWSVNTKRKPDTPPQIICRLQSNVYVEVDHIFETEVPIFHITGSANKSLYFTPLFILIKQNQDFAFIDYTTLMIEYDKVDFKDSAYSQILNNVKANKNTKEMKVRFSENHYKKSTVLDKINYGLLSLSNTQGFNEEFLISNYTQGHPFTYYLKELKTQLDLNENYRNSIL